MRPRGQGWSRQLLDLTKEEVKWGTNPMQVNLWVVTARLLNEDRKPGQGISPDGESGVVIFPVKNLSKVSRSCPCEKTEIDLETALMREKRAGIKPPHAQAKNDQVCLRCQDALPELELIALESFRVTLEADDL